MLPEERPPVLETAAERRARRHSHWIVYITTFVMSIGFSIVLTGVWPYLQQVRPRLCLLSSFQADFTHCFVYVFPLVLCFTCKRIVFFFLYFVLLIFLLLVGHRSVQRVFRLGNCCKPTWADDCVTAFGTMGQ